MSSDSLSNALDRYMKEREIIQKAIDWRPPSWGQKGAKKTAEPILSIDAAAKELSGSIFVASRERDGREKAIREILTRHFGTVILAAAGEKGQDDA